MIKNPKNSHSIPCRGIFISGHQTISEGRQKISPISPNTESGEKFYSETHNMLLSIRIYIEDAATEELSYHPTKPKLFIYLFEKHERYYFLPNIHRISCESKSSQPPANIESQSNQ